MLMVRRVLVECAQVKTPDHQYRLDAFLYLWSLWFLIDLIEIRVALKAEKTVSPCVSLSIGGRDVWGHFGLYFRILWGCHHSLG